MIEAMTIAMLALVPPADTDADRALGLAYALHLGLVAEVPLDVGVHAWLAAGELDVDPYDLAAAVVSENSWRYGDMSLAAALERPRGEMDYEGDAVGAAGERGVAQVAPYWAGKARTRCEEDGREACAELEEDRLGEARVNMRVAAFVVLAAHESHAEHAVSHREIRRCKREWRKFDRGERAHVPTCPLHDHGWGAHFKLGRQDRDKLCGQPGFQIRKLEKVRASLVSIVRPSDVWEAHADVWAEHCGGEA